MTYRPPTDGFLTCYRCGADVSEGAAFCPACGAPQDVAVPMGRRSNERPAWLLFAIIGGGIAALGLGVLLAILLGGGPEQVAGDPSPSQSASQAASAGSSASSEPSESAEATPTAEPTPGTAPIIPNLGIASVVTDALNLRSQPNEGATIVDELATGSRLFVIGQPTEAGELRWYRVATLSQEVCTEEPCDFVGYVATPVAIDDPWIEQVTVDCPTSPMTADDLATLAPLEALHCYGNSEIVVTGTIADFIGGYESPIRFEPEWLGYSFAPPYFETDGAVEIGYHGHPDADLEPPEAFDVVRVTGHYEDPAAPSCSAFVDPEFPDPESVELPDPVLLVLSCRATLVWTDYEITGP